MSIGLRAAALRLPDRVPEIGQLIVRDEGFRSICDDLAAAESFLSEIDQLPETVREERRREYQSLTESLVAEIEDALRRAKVVPITGAKRHPELLSDDEFEGQQELERSLMLNQIARIVADAKANRSILSASHHAARLFADFPHANLTVARIVEEIVHAAKQARVTVQLGRTD